MEQTIRISAEVQQHDRNTCKFTVDRPVFRGYMRFKDAERAKGSPLPEKLFAMGNVTQVTLQDNDVILSAVPPVDWRTVGPSVGAAIRAHLESGQSAVSEQAQK